MLRGVKKLFDMTGTFRRFVILTLFRLPFDTLLNIVNALFLEYAFDAVNGADKKGLMTACALFGVVNIFLFLYNGTVWTIYSAFAARWAAALRRKLFRHISSLSLKQMEDRTAGEWITRLNSDLMAAAAVLNEPIHLPHAAVALVNICVSSVILFLTDPKMFGLVILFVAPHLLISQLVVAKPMTRLKADVQEAMAKNTSDMHAIIACADTALIYDAQGFLLKRFEKSSMEIMKKNMRLHNRRALGNGLLPLMGISGYFALLLAGGVQIAGGMMTFGSLTAVLQYRGGLLKSMMMLVNCIINLKTAMAGVRRVCETMSIRPED
ncbi:MAG TPA: ABC transporter ATP-binding protein [Clostridiales bacterium]|nr:ABC transporter ATP-binding protein [Clostridiales bacterium]